MTDYQSLSHTRWECRYQVVFILEYWKKRLFGEVRRHLGETIRKRESRIEEGHLLPDHVHIMISIPPKYSVTQVIRYIKGKSAIHIATLPGSSLDVSGTSLADTSGPGLLRVNGGP